MPFDLIAALQAGAAVTTIVKNLRIISAQGGTWYREPIEVSAFDEANPMSVLENWPEDDFTGKFREAYRRVRERTQINSSYMVEMQAAAMRCEDIESARRINELNTEWVHEGEQLLKNMREKYRKKTGQVFVP